MAQQGRGRERGTTADVREVGRRYAEGDLDHTAGGTNGNEETVTRVARRMRDLIDTGVRAERRRARGQDERQGGEDGKLAQTKRHARHGSPKCHRVNRGYA